MAIDRIHIYWGGDVGQFTDDKSLLVLVPLDRKPDDCRISGRKQVPVYITTHIMIDRKCVELFERSIQEVIKELKERFIR